MTFNFFVMKRLLVIFSLIFPGLLLYSAFYSEPVSLLYRNSFSQIKQDTIDYLSFIKTDSFKLTILKPSSGVQFYKDGIIFLSLSKNEAKIPSNHISFGTTETYFAVPEDSSLGKHMIFSPSSSFSYPCEAISFSSDFNTMYFTKIPKKESKEKIYRANYISLGKNKTGWVSDNIPLDFCKGNYTYSHPTITSDEKVMIFASDKDGSFGGMDLFVTRKEGDIWSTPQNLGKSVNSPGNEFFPFLDAENNLYFSSDGHPGYGGYDIFTCRYNGKVWDKPINLSDRINTKDDDIAFVINKMDGRTAFYTRKNRSLTREMQLFRVTLNKEYAGSDQLTFSNIFHGNHLLKPGLIASNTNTKAEPAIAGTTKTVQKAVIAEKKSVPAPVKNKREARQKIREIVVIAPAIVSNILKIQIYNEPEIVLRPIPVFLKTVSIAPETVLPAISKNKDEVVYRVQILSSKTSKGSFKFTVNDKIYDTYEYFYQKEYRYTIGEFSTLKDAVELQDIIRRDVTPLVFVVVFINNVRSLDPKLFK
jgi:hypothetical protein